MFKPYHSFTGLGFPACTMAPLIWCQEVVNWHHDGKQDTVTHACHLNICEVEEGKPKLQGHPRLCNDFEASLGYLRYYLKQTNKMIER